MVFFSKIKKIITSLKFITLIGIIITIKGSFRNQSDMDNSQELKPPVTQSIETNQNRETINLPQGNTPPGGPPDQVAQKAPSPSGPPGIDPIKNPINSAPDTPNLFEASWMNSIKRHIKSILKDARKMWNSEAQPDEGNVNKPQEDTPQIQPTFIPAKREDLWKGSQEPKRDPLIETKQVFSKTFNLDLGVKDIKSLKELTQDSNELSTQNESDNPRQSTTPWIASMKGRLKIILDRAHKIWKPEAPSNEMQPASPSISSEKNNPATVTSELNSPQTYPGDSLFSKLRKRIKAYLNQGKTLSAPDKNFSREKLNDGVRLKDEVKPHPNELSKQAPSRPTVPETPYRWKGIYEPKKDSSTESKQAPLNSCDLIPSPKNIKSLQELDPDLAESATDGHAK